MYYTYILKSRKDSTFYIGSTKDPLKRLAQHNAGKSRYTKGHRPYEIVYKEGFDNRRLAEEKEKHIKSFKNTKKYLEMAGSPAKRDSPDKSGESSA